MTTISVDINENKLPNLYTVIKLPLENYNELTHTMLFEKYPFKIYKKRMMGEHMVTVQIPLDHYILFKVHGLVY